MAIDHPKQIGKYEILGVLGKGAMGLVYRAIDPLLKREVALKVITGSDITDEMKARFIHEARAVAMIDHPNIVVVYDLGDEGGSPYIAMELLKGEDLKSVMQRRPTLPVDEAVGIIAQVCDGLAYAHERKIVHRDIKPANIHLCPDGRVKVMDFGVAKMDSTSLTKTGMVIGTPDYMSPEQIQGKAVDARSDIFSTGVVFYELLTRSKPFTADSITSVIYNVVFKEPPSFSELELDVPASVERIIAKAMAKDLADRYQTMAEMAGDLRAVSQGQRPVVAVGGETGEDATTVLTPEELAEGTAHGMPVRHGRPGPPVDEDVAERDTVMGGPQGGAFGPIRPAAPKGRNKLPWIGLAAAVVAVAAALWGLVLKPEPPASPGPAATVGVEITVSPWARIESLERLDGKERETVLLEPSRTTTPVRLELAPGRYLMRLSNPVLDLQDQVEFSVDEGGRSPTVSRVLSGFDPGDALGTLAAPSS